MPKTTLPADIVDLREDLNEAIRNRSKALLNSTFAYYNCKVWELTEELLTRCMTSGFSIEEVYGRRKR